MIKTLITSFIILIFGMHYVSAGHKLEYFTKQLHGWGLEVYTLDVNNPVQFPKNVTDSYFLITSHELRLAGKEKLDEYAKVIVICDTTFELTSDISCDYSSINTSRDLPYFEGFSDYKLLHFTQGFTEIILLPEANFVLPKNIAVSADYFRALGKSTEAKDTTATKTRAGIQPAQSAEVMTPYLEFLGYLVVASAVILVIFFVRGIGANRYVLIDKFHTFYSIVHKYRLPIKFITLAFFALALVVNFYFLILDGLVLVRDSIYLFVKSPTFSVLASLPVVKSKLVVVVVGINSILCLLILASFLIHFPRNYRSFVVLFNTTITAKAAKPLIYILVILLLISAVFFGYSTLAEVHLFLVLSLCYVLVLSVPLVFTLREKILALSIICVTVFIAFTHQPIKTGDDILYSQDGLFSDTDRVILLPYVRNVDNNVKFSDYTIESNFPVFINSYLIYHPYATEIKNRHISEFDATKNFIIVSNGEDYFELLATHPELVPHIISSKPSKYVSFDAAATIQDVLTAQLTFDCTDDMAPRELFLRKYDSSMKVVEYGMVVFPGCGPDQLPVSYTVPMTSEFVRDATVFEINGYSKVTLVEFKVFKNDAEIPVKYLETPKAFQLIGERIDASNPEIYVYSDETTESVDITVNSKPFNLASVLNVEPLYSTLGNSFMIWSSTSGAMLSN